MNQDNQLILVLETEIEELEQMTAPNIVWST